jgi:hypothetical protein
MEIARTAMNNTVRGNGGAFPHPARSSIHNVSNLFLFLIFLNNTTVLTSPDKCFDGLLTQNTETSGYGEYLQKKAQEKVLHQQTMTQMAERASILKKTLSCPDTSDPPLPSGWATIVDHGSGRSFYVNESTQEILVFTLTEVFQDADRKRWAAQKTPGLVAAVSIDTPTPGIAAVASVPIHDDHDSVTVDGNGVPFHRSKKRKATTVSAAIPAMMGNVPGAVFVSPDIVRRAREAFPEPVMEETEGNYTIDSSALPNTDNILAFKLPAKDTDNESNSIDSDLRSANLLAP